VVATQPTVVVPPRTTFVPPAPADGTKVGGWGTNSSDDNSDKKIAKDESKDSVVPDALPPGMTSSTPVEPQTNEQRAKSALEEARKRNARA
jgi:hypothetical protein